MWCAIKLCGVTTEFVILINNNGEDRVEVLELLVATGDFTEMKDADLYPCTIVALHVHVYIHTVCGNLWMVATIWWMAKVISFYQASSLIASAANPPMKHNRMHTLQIYMLRLLVIAVCSTD